MKKYFCGKHKFQTDDVLAYHIHIIDDHDFEHGKYQAAGSPGMTQIYLKTKEKSIYYGEFRYLPIYRPLNCSCMCNTGSGCWNGDKCFEPKRHLVKTPEDYDKFLDEKWSYKK